MSLCVYSVDAGQRDTEFIKHAPRFLSKLTDGVAKPPRKNWLGFSRSNGINGEIEQRGLKSESVMLARCHF